MWVLSVRTGGITDMLQRTAAEGLLAIHMGPRQSILPIMPCSPRTSASMGVTMHMHMRLTCDSAGARTSGISAVGHGCWRIKVGCCRWGREANGHMRNSAGHSDTTQAVCSVFCADGTSTKNQGSNIMLECMHVGACVR